MKMGKNGLKQVMMDGVEMGEKIDNSEIKAIRKILEKDFDKEIQLALEKEHSFNFTWGMIIGIILSSIIWGSIIYFMGIL